MTLHSYVLIGLILWGLPGLLVAGPETLALVALTAVPVWFAARRLAKRYHRGSGTNEAVAVSVLLVLAVLYLLFDATLGRQKLAQNLFLSRTAFDRTVEAINENVSQGRGIVEMLGAVSIFVPFVLFDIARRVALPWPPVLRIVAGIFLFYEVGSSRGYALVAVAALALGGGVRAVRLAWAGAISLTVFALASLFRGDFEDVAFSNPFFDAFAWPFVNLGLMLNADCGTGTSADFVAELFKKFVPSFVFPKEVFSFNIEMTRCLYPLFGDYVESVSVFTYLGELHHYTPSLVTALAAGLTLAVLCHLAETMLMGQGLISTRVFAGLMCIVLLRSRVLDVASFLIFLLVFALLWRVAVRRWGDEAGAPTMEARAATITDGAFQTEPPRRSG